MNTYKKPELIRLVLVNQWLDYRYGMDRAKAITLPRVTYLQTARVNRPQPQSQRVGQ